MSQKINGSVAYRWQEDQATGFWCDATQRATGEVEVRAGYGDDEPDVWTWTKDEAVGVSKGMVFLAALDQDAFGVTPGSLEANPGRYTGPERDLIRAVVTKVV